LSGSELARAGALGSVHPGEAGGARHSTQQRPPAHQLRTAGTKLSKERRGHSFNSAEMESLSGELVPINFAGLPQAYRWGDLMRVVSCDGVWRKEYFT
jgi:hypothetical protein